MTIQEQSRDTALHEGLLAQYNGLDKEDGLGRLRAKAWDRYTQLGLPSSKVEVFRYLRFRSLYTQALQQAPAPRVTASQLAKHLLPECEGSCLVFVNGRYSAELSATEALPENVVLAELSEALGPYGSFLNNRWSKALREESDPFALLNYALHEQGLLVYLPANTVVKSPLQILHLIDAEQAFVAPRLQVFMGAHAEAHLVQTTACIAGSGFAVTDFLDVALEDGAHLQITKALVDLPNDAWYFSALRSSLKRDSRLRTLSLSNGSRCVREDYKVVLSGENAEVDLNGGWLLNERRESHTNVLIEHQAPHCRSFQRFKGVLAGHSRSSFEGKIFVHPEAQKTDAFQLNNNLLLSDHAEANSKPNLEIFADDVKASHGATIGQLDAEPLFYLRARGVPEAVAKAMLVRGFLKDLVDQVTLPSLEQRLSQELSNVLEVSG